jgi:hypothetical protein
MLKAMGRARRVGVGLAGLLVAAATAVTSASAGAAGGDTPDEEAVQKARQLFAEGVAAQDAAQYAEAIAIYRRAAQVAESPSLFFNVGTCEERLGHLARADAAYRRSLSLALARGAPDVVREAQVRLDALDAEVPRVVLHMPPDLTDASVLVDDQAVVADPTGVKLDPGMHRLVVRARSRARELDTTIVAEPHATRVVDVDLGAPPPPAPPPQPPLPLARPIDASPAPPPSYLPAALLGSGAFVAGAAAVVTGIVGDRARDRFLALNAAPSDGNRAEREDLRSTGQTLFAVNTVLSGLAIAATAVAVYFFVRPPASASSANRSVIVSSSNAPPDPAILRSP